MKNLFFTRLAARAEECNSLLCVGLDPHPDLLAEPTAAAAQAFCLKLIDACAPHACAFKPNSAFFEALGPAGIEALANVIAAVPDGIPVILDAKRGDIASTAVAYARAAYDVMGADAITASPYLGRDSLIPFLERPERGVFILCKTSNPGADELQSLPVREGEPFYLQVARQVQTWPLYNNVGLVVGATHPGALAQVRAVAPGLWFLAPGVGAQGGNLDAALAAGLRDDGLGMLVAVSRSIAQANNPAGAAANLKDAINKARRQLAPLPCRTREIAAALLKSNCVRFGAFSLKSGQASPIYLDLRRLVSHPRALQTVANAFLPVLRQLEFDRLAAIPYAALPIGTAIALAGNWPLVYPRRESKAYGTKSAVEGDFGPGETAVLIDDLVTTGGSKLETIEKLTAAGLKVRDIVVLIDRGQGATRVLAEAGYRLRALLTLRQLVDAWQAAGAISDQQVAEVTRYLNAA